MPATLTRLVHSVASSAVVVKVVPAAFSKRELDDEIASLANNSSEYAASGVDIRSIAAKVDGSGLDVGVAPTAGAVSMLATARSVLAASTTPIPITVGTAQTVTPTSRVQDLPDHWAGSRIETVQYTEQCTTGFPMRRLSDGRTFITTAYHCDNSEGNPTNQQWWNLVGSRSDDANRMGEAWYHAPTLDTAYIRPPNGAVAGWTYTAGVAPGTEGGKPIAGLGGNWSGLSTCTDGSYTGTHCDLIVDREYYLQIGYDRNNWVYMWYAYQKNNGTANGEGDSGGPVITNVANNHDNANGTISGGLGAGYSCTNNYQETTTCFHGVAFIDEGRILNWLGAALLTA